LRKVLNPVAYAVALAPLSVTRFVELGVSINPTTGIDRTARESVSHSAAVHWATPAPSAIITITREGYSSAGADPGDAVVAQATLTATDRMANVLLTRRALNLFKDKENMNFIKLLAAGAAFGIIVTTFRDENGEWIVPGRDILTDRDITAPDGEEPVLGYDGMDEESLEEWLSDAGADRRSILRMIRYESANRGRQPVLAALVDQL